MKQIKTIMMRTEASEAFDNKVNEALKDGWILVNRGVLHPYETRSYEYHRMFYAELEREEDEGGRQAP